MGAMSGGSRLYDPENGEAKILVVDDRPDKRLAFETILQELQQEIITASSGEEALKLVLEHEFAVVLLDVNMPGLDGLETAALIRKRKRYSISTCWSSSICGEIDKVPLTFQKYHYGRTTGRLEI